MDPQQQKPLEEALKKGGFEAKPGLVAPKTAAEEERYFKSMGKSKGVLNTNDFDGDTDVKRGLKNMVDFYHPASFGDKRISEFFSTPYIEDADKEVYNKVLEQIESQGTKESIKALNKRYAELAERYRQGFAKDYQQIKDEMESIRDSVPTIAELVSDVKMRDKIGLAYGEQTYVKKAPEYREYVGETSLGGYGALVSMDPKGLKPVTIIGNDPRKPIILSKEKDDKIEVLVVSMPGLELTEYKLNPKKSYQENLRHTDGERLKLEFDKSSEKSDKIKFRVEHAHEEHLRGAPCNITCAEGQSLDLRNCNFHILPPIHIFGSPVVEVGDNTNAYINPKSSGQGPMVLRMPSQTALKCDPYLANNMLIGVRTAYENDAVKGINAKRAHVFSLSTGTHGLNISIDESRDYEEFPIKEGQALKDGSTFSLKEFNLLDYEKQREFYERNIVPVNYELENRTHHVTNLQMQLVSPGGANTVNIDVIKDGKFLFDKKEDFQKALEDAHRKLQQMDARDKEAERGKGR